MTDLAQRLRDHVLALEGVRHPRAAPDRHRAARDYVAAQLGAAGLEVGLAPFAFRRSTHHNVVGLLRGRESDGPRLLIGAHFDSTPETPGADDNASGVAAMLECARLLVGTTPRLGIEFVGFDLEEVQTFTGSYRVGSEALARAYRGRGVRLVGALVLEMVGFRDRAAGSQIVPPLVFQRVPRTGDFLAAVGDGRSRSLLREFCAAAATAVPALTVVPYTARLRGWLLPLTRLSDNASFWDSGYPALMVTDTAFLRNPHYHRESDTAATLDFDFMADVAAVTAAAARRLAA